MSLRSRVGALTLAVTAGLVGLPVAAPAQAGVDIVERLRAVPGLTVLFEQPPPAPGLRFLFLAYRQPVDHLNPQAGTFQQRFSLLHRASDRPTVLHTTGYNLPFGAFRSEPARLLDANQISTEQRFFAPSRPQPADWTKLTIWQAATDHHRLIEALKPVYSANWISTGSSKGGMTSVYHRRFYPRDVDGVVAYVAPNDVVNRSDDAYDRFFDTVGTDPACRAALNTVQHQALTRRTELVSMYEVHAAANGQTFQVLEVADRVVEFAALDSRWTFWQFLGQQSCGQIPPATAGWATYADQSLLPLAPYLYQAATQLGWPQQKFRHVRELLRYPVEYNEVNTALPAELRSRHDPWPMTDIDRWVSRESRQMLFVYGGNDPWGAEPFRPSPHDSYTFTAPGTTHGGTMIARLTPPDAAAATATLRRWAGVSDPAAATQFHPGLDDQNPDATRRPL